MMKAGLLAVLLLFCNAVFAVVEYHAFEQPEQEQAYQSLINELRCLVCQNNNIADSNADLAKDLRNQVYQMIQQGQSKQQIIDFMTQRYGDFVLYRPAFNLKTGLLWLGPALFLLLGLIVAFLAIRRRRSMAGVEAISAEQQARISQLLEGERD